MKEVQVRTQRELEKALADGQYPILVDGYFEVSKRIPCPCKGFAG